MVTDSIVPMDSLSSFPASALVTMRYVPFLDGAWAVKNFLVMISLRGLAPLVQEVRETVRWEDGTASSNNNCNGSGMMV